MPSVASIAIATTATVAASSAPGGTFAGGTATGGTVAGAGGPFLDFMAGFLASLQAGTGEPGATEAAAETGLPAPLRRRSGAPGSEETLGEMAPPIAPPIGLVPPSLLVPLAGEGGAAAGTRTPGGPIDPGVPAAGTTGAPPPAIPAGTPAPTGEAAASPAGTTPPLPGLAGPDFAAALAALGLTAPPPGGPEPALPVPPPGSNPTVGADGPPAATPAVPAATGMGALDAPVTNPALAPVVNPAGTRTGSPLPAGLVGASIRSVAPTADPAVSGPDPDRPAAPAAVPAADPAATLTAAETEAALDLDGAPEADAARPLDTHRTPAASNGGGVPAVAQGATAAAALAAETAAETAADAGEETNEPGLPPVADPSGAAVRPTTAAAVTDVAPPGTPDAARTAPAEQVAAALHGAQQRGDRRLEIRLDPPELGKVDVRMQIGPEGEVRAHLVVERAETLDMMLRDQRGLERALEQTGVKLAEAGVSFSLRQEGGDGRGDPRSPYGETRRGEVADAKASGEPIPPASPYGRPTRAGGIDLRV